MAVAVSVMVFPATIDVCGALTVTVVSTGTTGVTVICSVFCTVTPPAVALAVIVATPAAIALTNPLLFTLAMPDAEELHNTVAAIAAPV